VTTDHALIDFIEQVLATAQAGATFSRDPFDIARFDALRNATATFLAQALDTDAANVRQWITLDSHYPTPKLDVRGLILDEQGNVLLVRERSDNRWTLPGGWCDIGESPRQTVEREVAEETGLHCHATRLLALFDKHKHLHPPQLPHAYKAFFYCQVSAGSLVQHTTETTAAKYFCVDHLPVLSEHRVLPSQIRLLHSRINAGLCDALFD
jgi:ADP-ribose pyrophosphatase YjhB (NUDIX family)